MYSRQWPVPIRQQLESYLHVLPQSVKPCGWKQSALAVVCGATRSATRETRLLIGPRWRLTRSIVERKSPVRIVIMYNSPFHTLRSTLMVGSKPNVDAPNISEIFTICHLPSLAGIFPRVICHISLSTGLSGPSMHPILGLGSPPTGSCLVHRPRNNKVLL